MTELALRAKAHWGYDASFIEDCRAELTITEGLVQNCVVRILAVGNELVGFYSLERQGDEVELAHFFVDPTQIGKGYGKQMWQDAIEKARSSNYPSLLITSDPFAEGFYLALGAERVGVVPSSLRPGRELPLMRFRL